MKIIHTSDWHIGRTLYGRKRYNEFEAFLDWLAELIEKENIDVLLVAGDIFDTSTPSNRAQEIYYRFLCRVSLSCCRHVVVIAGNHDSPSFLNAPKELLRVLNVHVTGSAPENLEDEVLVLKDPAGKSELIVCAVPYLRDRDIRTVEAGESIEDKNIKLVQGIKDHYGDVCQIAREKQKEAGNIPIVAMGHLFTAGGKTVDGDGVRELYVGSLAHVGRDIFPSFIDYIALGHLHVPQKTGDSENMRYCGSPIPMGYGEANQKKSVVLVEFEKNESENNVPKISIQPVPTFQKLIKISGDLDSITGKIKELKTSSSKAWLEIEYTGEDIAANLRESIDEAVAGSEIEVRKIRNKRIIDRIISRMDEEETLDDLNVEDVFTRCLDARGIPEEKRPLYIETYKETLKSMYEEEQDM
ncbi:exonuclease SbcCD subunit D C-terminal domain-containing protein [Desulforegula conservatrix]|uniref:exonuclease SbcCD subunit D C-terminal domain-containing protein n=1 Tax=Desulforegula conservatrix TaxID=153026 RepID=UPI0004245E43|nr:exonuclease SbcCD subunit D C-terminal domain-containing protein [Desulforegula conservatrix]